MMSTLGHGWIYADLMTEKWCNWLVFDIMGDLVSIFHRQSHVKGTQEVVEADVHYRSLANHLGLLGRSQRTGKVSTFSAEPLDETTRSPHYLNSSTGV